MHRIWISAGSLLLGAAVLGGCATSKDKLLPHGDADMRAI
ncbi:MAG TPA: TIGR03751 family conjugal transfer lipoprotein, partial [Rhodanobacter sp.]|nr:TIGR03751 family conjugal transfer lipoprotein [Rhodanobacter sp.]